MQSFLDLTFWNNTVLYYLIFLGSLILSIVVLIIFQHVLLKRLAVWAKKTPTVLDDLLVRTIKRYLMPIAYFGALYLNTKWLTINLPVLSIINVVTLAFMMIFGAVVLSAILVFLFNKFLEKKNKKVNKLSIKWFSVLIKIVIWVVMLLLFLDNQGVEITALVAGLGIGGLAIAFAAQAILEDVFSFVTIFFDRPFELDDFIIVDEHKGTIEHIGIKTTRVRSLSGEQLIFSNKDLTSSRIRNYKRMQNRRIQFTLGVTYDTPTSELKLIPDIIKKIIDDLDGTTFDRAHFKEFADFSLNYEIVYYVLSQDYNVYMDKQQEINFLIKEAFDKKGLEFAFPTQTIYMEK